MRCRSANHPALDMLWWGGSSRSDCPECSPRIRRYWDNATIPRVPKDLGTPKFRSVEAEVVAFWVGHHDMTEAHRGSRLLTAKASRSERQKPAALCLQRGHALLSDQSWSSADVEMNAVLGDLALGHLLEEQARSASVGSSIADRVFPCPSGTPTFPRNSSQAASGSAPSARTTPGGPGCTSPNASRQNTDNARGS